LWHRGPTFTGWVDGHSLLNYILFFQQNFSGVAVATASLNELINILSFSSEMSFDYRAPVIATDY